MAFVASVTAAQWAMTAAVTAVAATGVSAVSQIQQGKEQQKWSEYNAAVADRDAKAATAAAGYDASRKRKETERLLGRQRALYGKSGVTMEGSPLELMSETAAEGELDALMIERTGAVGAQKYGEEATLSRMKGSSAKRAGYWGAGTTLLTGASKAASGYGNYKLNS